MQKKEFWRILVETHFCENSNEKRDFFAHYQKEV
jgi:hypothetical protein